MRDDVVIHAVVHESTDHVWGMMFVNELVMHDLCFCEWSDDIWCMVFRRSQAKQS